MKKERRYFIEFYQNEEKAGIPHNSSIKKRIWIVNMLITLFALGLIIYSYFTYQFIWGVVSGLLILFYIHMLLFSREKI